MNFKIKINSEEDSFSIELTKQLKKWLSNEKTNDIKVKLNRKKIKPDEAGGEFEAILYIILNATAINTIAKSIKVWFKEKTKQEKSRVSKLSLTFEINETDKITINTENATDIEAQIIETLTREFKTKKTIK